MDTGIGNTHLYSACLVTAEHYYEPGDVHKTLRGTGFLAQCPDGQLALITNRHTLEMPWLGNQYDGYHLTALQVQGRFSDDSVQLATFRADSVQSHPDPTIDIAGFRMNAALLSLSGSQIIERFVNQSFLANAETLENSVEAGEYVFFPGYPEWYDRNGCRPIMRTGAIVSDPKSDYRLTSQEPHPVDGNQQILFDAFSTSGNSGSPVFVAQRGFNAGNGLIYNGIYRPAQLIGINAGHIKTAIGEHAGLSRMYKSTAILEFLAALTD